jgi:hypothetical protein
MARRPQTSPESNVVESILRTLWDLLKFLFGSKGKSLNAAAGRELAGHWSQVTALLENPATEGMAISEADKLLDAAFRALGLPGDRMSDRLRAAEGRLGRSLSNEVWRAHKLRNQLAHEVGAQLAPGQARVAVRTFEAALRALGVPV